MEARNNSMNSSDSNFNNYPNSMQPAFKAEDVASRGSLSENENLQIFNELNSEGEYFNEEEYL